MRLTPIVVAILVSVPLSTYAHECGQDLKKHNTECPHKHKIGFKQYSTCNTNGAACATIVGGTCKTQKSTISPSACWCNCVKKSSCGGNATLYLLSSDVGLPTEGENRTYSSSFDLENFVAVFLGPATFPHIEWDAAANALEVFLDLTFGSFAVPTAVPVTVNSAFATLPSFDIGGLPTGINSIQLRGGTPQQISYDSTTGILSLSAGPLPLELSNDMGTDLTPEFIFEGEIMPDGNIWGYGSMSGAAPPNLVFVDGFESGDTSSW